METMAEGVETEGQAALPEERGCDMVRGGCHFSEPLAVKRPAKRPANL
jgi:EAL domain-containing protein (putative c-di-GMP-specific phosphodiesterase class I)